MVKTTMYTASCISVLSATIVERVTFIKSGLAQRQFFFRSYLSLVLLITNKLRVILIDYKRHAMSSCLCVRRMVDTKKTTSRSLRLTIFY
ncbi:ORF161 [Leucania separata nucleopolyhedrovirus]|uniref:ORF161 n=1 Tax=Leucania separata nucleopolyhedrovirus TaxID=1307956 RepID=Q0IKV8_NPVLS|nr:ORF161 [Leucania separata nucleopolyhedrovirus]AAR28925.1 ORF161 [Leucania separata nucleopolyhedrovirus]